MRLGIGQFGLSATRLIFISAGFISVYFGFTIVGNRLHQYELDRQNADLERQIADAKTDYSRLQALQQWMQSDSFIASMARQQGMIQKGDTPILVGSPPQPAPTGDATGKWWERYIEPSLLGQATPAGQ